MAWLIKLTEGGGSNAWVGCGQNGVYCTTLDPEYALHFSRYVDAKACVAAHTYTIRAAVYQATALLTVEELPRTPRPTDSKPHGIAHTKASEVTAASIAKVLNEAWAADPQFIRLLLCQRWPVSQKLVDHPTIICDEPGIVGFAPPLPAVAYECSMLGLVNGFIGHTGKLVASKWGDPKEPGERAAFLGFCVVEASSVGL